MKLSIEKRTIQAMMKIYCKKNHGLSTLCANCNNLLEHAMKRIDHCPFKENKPACNKCKVHCYASEKREKIKEVMKFSGKRMLWKHPYLTTRHFMK
jgi:hypothetical protein